MSGKFNNQVIVVTGGNRGIGKAIVRAFAKEGGKVFFIFSKNMDAAETLVEQVRDEGFFCEMLKCNIGNEKECEHAVSSIIKQTGKIDVLINNAGITKDGIMLMQSSDDWKSVIDINFFGTYNITRQVILNMIKNRYGNIINISSVAGLYGVAGQTNYCSSKAAIIGFTKALSREIGGKKIRVNAIAPGYIETDMTDSIPNKDIIISNIPQKRYGKPEEVASVVLFLASEEASYINGTTIVVDGAYTA
ncbi:3-oxoacyl-ACP reductase FabG [Vallitalea maricola]|uniref:3-oxoacyl-[acyl-carrier-protein] reductase n=1 Tax=Vallitalea maricola TaxID=3074433 RepID=A0ACB5UJU9_9FIRM|nr:3-oxoacyl-[acyl-carrier-protein] reductase [Vallitalea sp. AN17-2]